MSDKIFNQIWDVIDRTGDKFRIRITTSAAETAYADKESGLMIGHCKAIIESFCKSLLDEKGVEYPDNCKIKWLAKTAVRPLT